MIAIIATHRDTRQLGKGPPHGRGYPEYGPTPPSLIFEKAGGQPCLGSDGLSLATALLSWQLLSRARRVGNDGGNSTGVSFHLCTHATQLHAQ